MVEEEENEFMEGEKENELIQGMEVSKKRAHLIILTATLEGSQQAMP